MINIESQLQDLANILEKEKEKKYESRFISIVNVLKSNLKVSEVKRGGSSEKQTKNPGQGDLDILFTYKKTNTTTEKLVTNTKNALKSNFKEIAKVEKKTQAVNLYFHSEDLHIDVVYLPYEKYLIQTKENKEVKETSKIEHDAIRLLKYYNENKFNRNLKPRDIELKVLDYNGKGLYNYVNEIAIKLKLNQHEVIDYLSKVDLEKVRTKYDIQ